MFQRAQDLIHHVSDRVKTTMQVVADIAESLGVPPALTSLLQRSQPSWEPPSYPASAPSTGAKAAVQPAPANDGASAGKNAAQATVVKAAAATTTSASSAKASSESSASKKVAPAPKKAAPAAAPADPPTKAADPAAKAAAPSEASSGNGAGVKRRRTSGKRVVEGNRSKSSSVRALKVDDAINGSTYLARIVWSLGVAQLEGLGPLRPADIARMVMSRSAVSLEPPNVARYIRRSKPTCIAIGHNEGSSSFYKLNAQGKKIFDDTFMTE